MMHYIYGSWLGLAVVGETAIAGGIVNTGTSIGNLGAAGILGVVCVACIYALVKVYKDKTADEQDLKSIIASSTKAISDNTNTLEKLNDNIDKCSKR